MSKRNKHFIEMHPDVFITVRPPLPDEILSEDERLDEPASQPEEDEENNDK